MTLHPSKKASAAVIACAEKGQQLFAAGQAEAALALAGEGLAAEDHVRLWRLKARLLVFFQREREASEILQRVLPNAWLPGFWELAQAGLPLSYALLADTHKVAYFPVRKCSSTSLHNVMAVLDGRTSKGEEIHESIAQYTLIDRTQQRETLADYLSVLVVRSPIDRIRSFYHGNIVGRGHLVRDTGGKESFYGLSTRPSYEEFLDNFHGYRRTFTTVRNHTDPLAAYVGTDTGLFDWVGGMHQTRELIELLSARSGIKLPEFRDMQAGGAAEKPASYSAAEQALMEFYQADYDTFSNWF